MAIINKNSLAHQKITAFLKVVSVVVKEKSSKCESFRMIDVYREANKRTAPRFYVQPNFAALQLQRIIQKKSLTVHGKYKIQMYNDLYERYKSISADKNFKKLDWNILCQAIYSEAPSFYINPETVRQLVGIYYRK